ncbi:hypothetical protein IQ13_3251 [Lacibacter cauensis]|uniref:Uncharacterized protein n=1 Tax=Lacibacter cauensis TaxID=510947 RepID=A0A562SH67_9BACT|nr:hypothetical protein [Lacibacter cauensis]TWI80572.1 hypothetical protein IQ13_3251 [Lacibacter cauensis]
MDTSFHIKNWLTTAFEEPVDRINETYYFDKLYNQFFSIFITDYYLLEEEPDTNIQSPYSDKDLQLLKDRVNRIESKDSSIVYIPRLSIDERKQIIKEFLERNPQSFDNEKSQLLIDDETGRNYFDLKEISNGLKSEWKIFKVTKILEKAETFCNLSNIDIESASLWTDTKVTSISWDLTEPKNKTVDKELKVEKKVWWKFW